MTRLNKIHLTFLIVLEYKKQMKKNVSHNQLLLFIRKKTGASDETARKYITALLNGIEIEGQIYKIRLYNGGYECVTQT